MTAKLVTRLAGARVVIQQLPSGIGPDVWVGSYTSANRAAVFVDAATPAGLTGVLTNLYLRARFTRLQAVP